MIVVRAPLRISIGGGGTDLPFFHTKYGGSIVAAAIDKYIYIIVQKRDFYDDFLIRYSKIETPKKVDEIQHTRIKAALEFLQIKDHLEITAVADAPANTGLGSSSTFLVALLKALHLYKKEDVSAKTLAEEASHIEINILKEPIGKQDQYVSSFGGIIHMDIDKNGNVMVSPLNSSYTTLEELENNTLLFSTNIKRSTTEILSNQAKEAESDENKMKQMFVIKEIGEEIKNALEKGETTKFGHWLNVHWESKKNFGKMTTPEIDLWYTAALNNGALGGKIVGAGGGGFLMVYCEDKKEKLREEMKKLGLKEMPFRFDLDGCKVVYNGK